MASDPKTEFKTQPESNQKIKKALKAAFPYTIPIFAGFWFLALTYGIYMHACGFSFWYPALMSLTIFAGSIEFVTVSMLMGPFDPLSAFLMTLMVNARHLFYGISMLDRYRTMGWKKLYLIFGMCDETFSINYTADIPEDVDRGWFMFFVTLLNHFYWFSGALVGGLFGSLIQFNTEGLEFVMVAMFVVIFMEQWLKEKQHISSLIGLALGAGCLAIFGASQFMIPAMVSILLVLTLLRKKITALECGPDLVINMDAADTDTEDDSALNAQRKADILQEEMP
ncbi:AzlC family ABC transporter permease [Erysipelotrichaceae bacterium 51-3]